MNLQSYRRKRKNKLLWNNSLQWPMQKERYEDNHIDTELTEYIFHFLVKISQPKAGNDFFQQKMMGKASRKYGRVSLTTIITSSLMHHF